MHEEILLAEDLVAAFLASLVAVIAWRIGRRIGFSKPWKEISFGFSLIAAGRILASIDEAYIHFETLTINELAIASLGFIIAGFALIIIGIRSLYVMLCKEPS